MARSRKNPGTILDAIRAGDRVSIVDRFGKVREGRAVMRGPHGWVLNMGGRHGTPAVATPENITKVKQARRNPLQHEGNGHYENTTPAKRAAALEREGYPRKAARSIAAKEARAARSRRPPRAARRSRSTKENPPRGVVFSRRVLRLEYEHALNGDGGNVARRHDFGPGVQMIALPDGSVLLKHRDPRKRVWADLPDRGR